MTYEKSETWKAVEMSKALEKLATEFDAEDKSYQATRVRQAHQSLPSESLSRLYTILKNI
jgi:hypothetical protein